MALLKSLHDVPELHVGTEYASQSQQPTTAGTVEMPGFVQCTPRPYWFVWQLVVHGVFEGTSYMHVGAAEHATAGLYVGFGVGARLGDLLGERLGRDVVGALLGARLGALLGARLGARLGRVVVGVVLGVAVVVVVGVVVVGAAVVVVVAGVGAAVVVVFVGTTFTGVGALDRRLAASCSAAAMPSGTPTPRRRVPPTPSRRATTRGVRPFRHGKRACPQWRRAPLARQRPRRERPPSWGT